MSSWNPVEETLLSNHLAEKVCDRASGAVGNECVRNFPRDTFFIGNLRPRPIEDEQEDAAYFRELLTKLAPVAFGAEFGIGRTVTECGVQVSLRWDCYYRVFPTYMQQSQQRMAAAQGGISQADPGAGAERAAVPVEETEDATATSPDADESPEVTESQTDRRLRRRPADSLYLRFKKIACHATGIVQLRKTASWTDDTSQLQAAVAREIARAEQEVRDDPEHLRVSGSPEDRVRVPDTALVSEQSFADFCQTLTIDVIPQWGLSIAVSVRDAVAGESTSVVGFEFTNTSADAANSPNCDVFLFNCSAMFEFVVGAVLPFEIELAPRGFRYDRQMWGRGFNCAVTYDSSANIFRTTFTPRYYQRRLATRSAPRALFSRLSTDPLPVLDSVAGAMQDYRNVWAEVRNANVQSDPGWGQRFGPEFDRDAEIFDNEISRFGAGLELIRRDAEVRMAFQLTNETFRRLGDHPIPTKRKDSWRLFQLVFIVTQIPGIVSLRGRPNDLAAADDREVVDIIYFPTGGGKTEAYLGTLAFHCFFDRLRGKTAGVTAWTRFPLRLLTLQQTQRFADVIGTAELIRQEQVDPRLSGQSVDGFAVGYFVGAEATPNELVNVTAYQFSKDTDQVNWSRANDPEARQEWRRLLRCPSCKTPTVFVDFDDVRVRLLHRCTNPDCAFPNGVIPVFVVDNEIYRYLPSAIVGTIDKLAGIGNQRKLAQIFGVVDGRCAIHGYYKGKCCQKECFDARRLAPGVPPGLTGPTLFIQDELHLLKEGLGTFDSHYESFVQRLRQEYGQRETLKIIASSATIEAFERQVLHLYGRRAARVFPGLGPRLGASFYAEALDYEQRIYVGLIPHNKTIFNAILELIELYSSEISILRSMRTGELNPYGGSVEPGSRLWRELLDFYSTSLAYFLNGNELAAIHTDLESDTNPRLVAEGEGPLNVMELTGNVPTGDVSRILDRLEREAPGANSEDVVLATSMVSHGVDIDRLNAMVFYGMPRQNAEYIQASSRVGRTHAGIVFNVLHPARERDRSHYAYFVKFHEFLGQLVEPVAINRWARFSAQRTLPGLFMGVLLQVIANRPGVANPNKYYMLDFVKQQISGGALTEAEFTSFLQDAYLNVAGSEGVDATLRPEIRLRVQQLLDQIIGAGSSSRFVSEVLTPKPMMSLRDVDKAITIELDSAGTQWVNRS